MCRHVRTTAFQSFPPLRCRAQLQQLNCADFPGKQGTVQVTWQAAPKGDVILSQWQPIGFFFPPGCKLFKATSPVSESFCGMVLWKSRRTPLLAQQAAVFREGGGFFDTIPDSSGIVKPVEMETKNTGGDLQCCCISVYVAGRGKLLNFRIQLK